MNNKALKTLEYSKITEMLSSFAESLPGKRLCLELQPLTRISEIETSLSETSAGVTRILKGGGVSFANIYDLNEQFERLKLGGVLNLAELLKCCAVFETASKAKTFGKKGRAETDDDVLQIVFDSLVPCTQVSAEIRRCVLSENEISDDASADLLKIRRSIKTTEDNIHSKLQSYINGSMRSYLQDGVITTRNGRYCLPVKSDSKANVQGLVHDQSATGATLFIEPMSIVKLNNDIREQEAAATAEIKRIIAALSAMVFEHLDELKLDITLLAKLDFIFAKAHLSLDMKASSPSFNENGVIELHKARHPLLPKETAVPIDITLGGETTMLVITGPNTGGKTVSLKTVGLLTLMGQSGLHIPAFDGSILALFDEIYADIGDEQSIELSLSTFSAHMVNIVSIIKNANDRSLVLFDELGAGTDPVEGAALAVSILSFLHDMGSTVIATTHYSELKLFALTEKGVENACCEFDLETLKPTYRLLTGVAGKSNAFAISQKLGLPDFIIENAKEKINEKDETFEEVLQRLESQRLEYEKETERARLDANKSESVANEYEKLRDNLKAERDSIRETARLEAAATLKEAKDFADKVIRKLQKTGAGKEVLRSLEKERTDIREKINALSENASNTVTSKVEKSSLKPCDIQKGDDVKVLSMNLKGVVSTLPDAKGFLFVQTGILRTKIHISDIVLVNSEQKKYTSNYTGAGNIAFGKAGAISTEIKLLGKNVDEAVAELDKYLDDAALAHLNEVRVVHGKGTGALRNGIHRYLKGNKKVKEFHLAAYGEGDAGVTIVKLK